jgi:hypothetical protein
MANGPLSGIPIVDFTENMAGPFGTMILADQGADVVKVESQVLRNWLVRAPYPSYPSVINQDDARGEGWPEALPVESQHERCRSACGQWRR